MRYLVATLGLVVAATPALAQQAPPGDMVYVGPPPAFGAPPPPQVVNSHILFLNNCRPNGCTVLTGNNDSRTDHSSIGHGTLSALGSGTNWASVVTCIKAVMAPFNITVTDVDPGSQVDHFEVMIAGQPQQLGLSGNFGGVAPYNCGALGQCNGQYITNALVFAFDISPGNTTLYCGTAAQEIAHAWNLDHSTLANDPMTYKNYATPLMYRDNAPCGSDCDYTCPGGGVCNAFNVPCTGSGQSGTHACMETGTATQNEVQIITALFGPAGAKPPMVAITAPANSSAQQTGQAFPVTATCTSTDGIMELDFFIDGIQKATLTTSPATFTAPNNLTEGSHHLSVSCSTKLQASATAAVDVIVGTLCASDGDCANNGICYLSACIAGPNAPGGLGAGCKNNGDCKSGSCGSDGTQSLCVVPCDLANDQCPSGFGCLDAGNMSGVCWLGADRSSGGCCETGGDGRGSILLGLGFAAMFVTWKRPKKRR